MAISPKCLSYLCESWCWAFSPFQCSLDFHATLVTSQSPLPWQFLHTDVKCSQFFLEPGPRLSAPRSSSLKITLHLKALIAMFQFWLPKFCFFLISNLGLLNRNHCELRDLLHLFSLTFLDAIVWFRCLRLNSQSSMFSKRQSSHLNSIIQLFFSKKEPPQTILMF